MGHYFGMTPVIGRNVAMISVPTSHKNNCETVNMSQVSKNVFLMLTTYIYSKTSLGYTDNFSTTFLQQSGKSTSYKVHAVNCIKLVLCVSFLNLLRLQYRLCVENTMQKKINFKQIYPMTIEAHSKTSYV